MKVKHLLLILVPLLLAPELPAQQIDDKNYQINWRDYSFSTKEDLPVLIPALTITDFPEDEQRGYYFVQFTGPVTTEMKKAVTDSGAELLDYVSNYAYLIRMSGRQRDSVAELAVVQWLGIFQPALRISKSLRDKLTDKETVSPTTEIILRLVVYVFKGENLSEIKNQIELTGAEIYTLSEEKRQTKILIGVAKGDALGLAAIHGVKWIEEYGMNRLFNDVARGIMGVTPVWNTHGLNGNGQIIAIADNGLDSGEDDGTMHDDLEGRIHQIFSWPVQEDPYVINAGADDGAAGVEDGHGTHVSGSALGNGSISGGDYSGVAPEAKLVFQALMQETHFIDDYSEGNGYHLWGIPFVLKDLFQEAYDEDARIHSNSWGIGSPGEYNFFSEYVDEFVWDNPDMLILYASGNSGWDSDSDNVIDKGSVSPPGTAKNCLTVGASESNRPVIPQTWSIRSGSVFNSDLQADQPTGMAAGSSRGPANSNTESLEDDIIKPDLVAPGTMIVSARSQATANTIWFKDDMESGVNGWNAEETWDQVTSDAHSGTTSWHDSPGGDYEDGKDMRLYCPVQDISGGGPGSKVLQFWYKYDLGTGDQVTLNIDSDDWPTWSVLLGSETQAEWKLFTRPLGPFLHNNPALVRNWSDDANLQVSFRLQSNSDGDTGDGFYVDDLRIVEGAYTDARLSDFGLTPVGSEVDENYLLMGGTSMSTPLVAGAAAIVRQYYTELKGLNYVSAALLRATLINGAIDINPGQYGSGATREIEARPDNVQGWGRVNLENSIFPAAPASLDHIDELAGLESGESHTYSYHVSDHTAPVVITMVYHDRPGVGLVNNLDMTVLTPDGETLYPNGLTTTDNTNNVEQIVISAPQEETYTIHIEGQLIPEGFQPYAIAISGAGSITDRDPVDVMLVLDLSGSMLSPACPSCDEKLQVLKDAVELFVQLWSAVAVPGDRLGVNYFKTHISNLTIGGQVLFPAIGNTGAIISDVQDQNTTYSNLTAMGGGLQSAINTLDDNPSLKRIILFTDGMQNVNPMVIRKDDSPPPDAFLLDIDNESGRPPSGVSPTDPVTTLDDGLDIKINTIGVGASPAYVELLAEIADKTKGVIKTTTAPDNDLRRFYVEELIDVLRDYSPQLLGYRYGTLSGSSATESFHVNEGAGKIILMCSWKEEAKISFEVFKDGVSIPPGDASVQGSFYQIFVLDFEKDSALTSGGEWEMIISGSQGATYEVAAIVDDPDLDYSFSIGGQNKLVGDALNLEVRLSYDGKPITDASRVQARILRPQTGMGSLLSTTSTPASVPDKFRAEDQSSPGQLKHQKLLSVNSFHQELIPLETVVELKNNGNGSYSATFNNTTINGVYKVLYDIEGSHPEAGEYRRTESLSAMLSYDETRLSKSKFYKSLEDETGSVKYYLVHIRPKDAYGNYLGPDYGNSIQIVPSSLQAGDIIDKTDGSYQIPIQVGINEDPEISIVIKGHTVFDDKVSSIKDRVEDRSRISVHGGWAYPTGTLANQYASGYLVELDFEYLLKPNISLEAVLGRYSIGNSYDISGGALYLKAYFPIKNQTRGYGSIGPGLYKPDNVKLSFGLSAGLGITGHISPHILYDVCLNYSNVFAPDKVYLNWAGLKAGIKYVF